MDRTTQLSIMAALLWQHPRYPEGDWTSDDVRASRAVQAAEKILEKVREHEARRIFPEKEKR